MNYDEMSDFQINEAVAKALGIDVEVCTVTDYRDGIDNSKEVLSIKNGPFIDYCNNPSDAWPIIIDNNISLYNEIIRWQASILHWIDGEGVIERHTSTNPLRAAMIVFLMITAATGADK